MLFIVAQFTGYALSQSPIVYATPAVPVPGPGSAPVVMGSVAGFVVDVDGNPVSNAIVSLWGDGQIVRPSGGLAGNPQISRLYSLSNIPDMPMGYFQFFGVYPGNYTVTAEKEGYKGSATVFVSNDTVHQFLSPADMQVPHNDTVMANITLSGYHAQLRSAEELEYSGAVTGVVKDGEGDILVFVNVSLWQNGIMVGRPDNPQYSNLSGDRSGVFLFEHLQPGRYEVWANKTDAALVTRMANVTVDVNDKTVVANIILENFFYRHLPPGASRVDSSNITTPIPAPIAKDGPRPSPSSNILYCVLAICAVLLLYLSKKKLPPEGR